MRLSSNLEIAARGDQQLLLIPLPELIEIFLSGLVEGNRSSGGLLRVLEVARGHRPVAEVRDQSYRRNPIFARPGGSPELGAPHLCATTKTTLGNRENPVCLGRASWAMTGSNRRPSVCKTDALTSRADRPRRVALAGCAAPGGAAGSPPRPPRSGARRYRECSAMRGTAGLTKTSSRQPDIIRGDPGDRPRRGSCPDGTKEGLP